MEKLFSSIKLLVLVLTLGTALLSFWQSCNNSGELDAQKVSLNSYKSELERLRASAFTISSKFSIDYPTEGDIIEETVFTMHGKYKGGLPDGCRLYVLAKDQYNYFLMYPPTQIVSGMKQWLQTNIRLGTKGRWQLYLCMANEHASEWLEEKVKNDNQRGFSFLPEGLELLRYVTISKE